MSKEADNGRDGLHRLTVDPGLFIPCNELEKPPWTTDVIAMTGDLKRLAVEIPKCRRCPRLNAWRAEKAAHPPKRFAHQRYNAKPVSGFGDHRARILIIGLAPAADGANRTGRIFTGDRSGDWLYRALWKADLANRPESVWVNDGLKLRDVYVTAVCRCAPPENKPTQDEIANCSQYLDRELEALWKRLRVIVPLGQIALKAACDALRRRGIQLPRPLPKFGHGVEAPLGRGAPTILMCYHPSQRNTFTGTLTEPMFDAVWRRAKRLAGQAGG
jgi:uracil-DNA glycosylase family 4